MLRLSVKRQKMVLIMVVSLARGWIYCQIKIISFTGKMKVDGSQCLRVMERMLLVKRR